MKIAEINIMDNGSTGNIMFQIADFARNRNHEVKTFSTLSYTRHIKIKEKIIENHIYYGSYYENIIHFFAGAALGRNGCFSYYGTKHLVKELEKFKPDIIHLHVLHKFGINLRLLFDYIKKNELPVIWTFHDCWAFTGQCPHFDMIGCDKWKTGCHDCPQHLSYPKSYIDNSKKMFLLKKKWFLGVKNLTIVTPSKWLSELVKESFMKDYQVEVINNGIDVSIFKPTETDFRDKYNCRDKIILLGVASAWTERKGIDVFFELAKRLSDNYYIVLVGGGLSSCRDSFSNIITIPHTESPQQLAEIYSTADIFINPTREETYPTVNMEALSCGTPVVTFKTGGSPEIIDETCGIVVKKNDIDAMEKSIYDIVEKKLFSTEVCLKKAQNFNKRDKFNEYIDLYEKIGALRHEE